MSNQEHSPPNVTNEAEIRDVLKKVEPTPGDQPYRRKLLLDGFSTIKKRMQLHESQPSSGDYGGFAPATVDYDLDEQFHWVDNFIKSTLGGKREGLTVVWEIKGSKFVYDPWLHKLSQE